MIGLVQRVKSASVKVDAKVISSIEHGILLLVGVEKHDSHESMTNLARKVANIRIFEDDDGKMNNSIKDVGGQLLVVSQFTLAASTKKGNRPGFSDCAGHELGNALYQAFIQHYSQQHGPCMGGQFGANMQVELINDGPATFYLQT